MTTRIPASRCRNRLALVWFVAGGCVFVVLLVQSIGGTKYGSAVEDAWGWFLPTIMPTLSLIVGVLVLSAVGGVPERKVDQLVYRLAMGLSIVYLLTVASTILAEPFVDATALQLMKRSNLWLGPLQGLVTAALGAFFVAGE